MTVFFPLESFFEKSGKQVLAFNEGLRDAVATFACELWQEFPDWMTQNALPATAFARGFYNAMCSPIQAPVPPPDNGFVGGQCEGVLYDVAIRVVAYQFNSCQLLVDSTEVFRVLGPIEGVFFNVDSPDAGKSSCFNLNQATVQLGDWQLRSGSGITNVFANVWLDAERASIPPLSTATIEALARVDGLPDDCGNGPGRYPPNAPTPEDLRKITIVNVNDGLGFQLEIKYNQNNNTYNFPTTFKVNGINVAIDLGGMTIYGNPQTLSPSNDNSIDPPGSDGGTDGVGGTNDKIYPADFPALPDFVSPEVIADIVEYLICIDGVISTIEETIEQIPAFSGPFAIILKVILNILKDVCAIEDNMEASVGLPEYYGLKPGVSRPAIVYLWKEYVDQTWSKSTWSSTVHHPTDQAIDAINSLESFTKQTGTFVRAIKLIDGSTIKATGKTQVDAINNFNFLLNQVKPEYIPQDEEIRTTETKQPGIDERILRLRQIEYYPDGKDANKSPTIRKILRPPM